MSANVAREIMMPDHEPDTSEINSGLNLKKSFWPWCIAARMAPDDFHGFD